LKKVHHPSICYGGEALCTSDCVTVESGVTTIVSTPTITYDYEYWLGKLALHEPTAKYRRNETGEYNAAAQLHPAK
jgi:hypothetical protein